METSPRKPAETETVTLRIADVVYSGKGLSRDGGIVTFVPGVLPGELVSARIVASRKRFREAQLVEVLEASPDRIPDCCALPSGGSVPGCVYGHARYAAEVALKDAQLRDFLRRIATPDTAFPPPFPSPDALGYRNKVVFHVQRRGEGDVRIGYLGDDNRTVVDMESCPLALPAINYAWTRMRDRARRHLRDRDTLTLRHTRADGVVSWTNRPDRDAAPLTEDSPIGPLQLPPDGFYQVNRPVAAALLAQVREWTKGAFAAGPYDTLLDLYCGIGVFGLAAALDGAPRVVGVESGRAAVAAATANAAALGIDNAGFRCATAAEAAATGFGVGDLSHAVAIVDPPRAGLEPATLAALASSALRTLVYVSCDPATLARDLAALAAAGFAVQQARVFDMFPRTQHFETACLLARAARP